MSLTGDDLFDGYAVIAAHEVISDSEEKSKADIEKNLIIQEMIKSHYIDVGQGDSEFIELPNRQTMLIDAGESNKGSVVVKYIKSLGYDKIDYVVATHPHSDHIGGMAEVLNNFQIGKMYMPDIAHTCKW